MPDIPNSRWDIYSCNHIHLNNVLQNEFDWKSVESICNDKNIILDIIDHNGRMIPKSSIYIKMARTGYYVLAIRKQDTDKLQTSSVLYINLYVDSSIPNDVSIVSHNPLINDNYQTVLSMFTNITDFTTYKLFIDGYLIESDKFLSVVSVTKFIEIINDANIHSNVTIDMTNRETYQSNIENLIKDVVYIPTNIVDDHFISFDTLEIYVVGTKGVLLPFNDDFSVSQLTNNFFGITSSLIDNCKTFLDEDDIYLKLLWKKFDDRASAIDTGYSLHILNEIFTDEEQEKLISDEHLPNLNIWKGSTLEYHPFNDYVFDNNLFRDYNDLNLSKQIKALGYANFIGTIANVLGKLQVTSTSIETLIINKSVLFTGVDLVPILYIDGKKIDQILYDIENTETEVKAVFHDPYSVIPGTVVRYKLIEKYDMFGHKFTPNAGNNTVTFSNDGPIVIYAKEAIESKGPNGLFDYGFTEIDSNSPLITVTNTQTDYTVTFDTALFDKEIHIFFTNKKFVVNRFEVDISDGSTISVEPYFLDKTTLDRLPIKYSDSFEVYLNGFYLVPDLDFVIHRSECDDPDIVGEFFITINNLEFLKQNTNVIEVYGTDHHVIRRDTTYVIDNKTEITRGNLKCNEHITSIAINGKIVDYDDLRFNKGFYDVSYPNGSVVAVTTSLPRNIKDIFASYEYTEHEDELDDMVDYIKTFYSPIIDDIVVVPNTHSLYSSYLNTVINLLLNGTITIPFSNTITDLLTQLDDWEFIKNFDIFFKSPNKVDSRFIDFYPGYLANRFTNDMGLRLIIDRLMNYYLNNDHRHDGHVVFRDSVIIGKPVIISPSNNATNVSVIPIIEGSPFSIEDHFYGNHTSTDWQIATDTDFNNIVYESLEDTDHLTSIQVNIPLSNSTEYYVRCRYNASYLNSRWSNYTKFTTTD
jgi:hypothetical protein